MLVGLLIRFLTENHRKETLRVEVSNRPGLDEPSTGFRRCRSVVT